MASPLGKRTSVAGDCTQILKFTFFTVVFCWFQIQLRWTVPKFRFDQTMGLGWKKLLPLSLVNIIVTALVILTLA
ncbi:MAG: hypothetical protein Ct9H300mP28_34750 [Pseudomonadota bacterium]|nr:MAG: hypothetical protein Ct9H300mP28_34750 [Pseudomonadota bacterium]